MAMGLRRHIRTWTTDKSNRKLKQTRYESHSEWGASKTRTLIGPVASMNYCGVMRVMVLRQQSRVHHRAREVITVHLSFNPSICVVMDFGNDGELGAAGDASI